MKAELIKAPPKSSSLGDFQNYIAECVSVVRDKTPKSAEKLWNRLLTESFGGTASRVFEYIPCTVPSSDAIYALTDGSVCISSSTQLFGFFVEDDIGIVYKYCTTMRELLNWGWSVDQCLAVVDFTNYRTFKCETPYFIYGQLSTHNQITSVSHSQRYGVCDRGYWMPPEYLDYNLNHLKAPTTNPYQDMWNSFVEETPPNTLKFYMKERLGIVRKEVWDRGADMLQNRVFTLGGYTSNPNAFPHFIDQRLDSHTQKETREFVQQLKELISEP